MDNDLVIPGYKSGKCIRGDCHYDAEPSFSLCNTHLERLVQRDQPTPQRGRCGVCGKAAYSISVFCSRECRTNYYEDIRSVDRIAAKSTNAPHATKEGAIMSTQTYSKATLIDYAYNKITSLEQTIENHTVGLVDALRQLVADFETDAVSKDDFSKEVERRMEERHREEIKSEYGPAGARREIKAMQRLVRQLEAIDGDTLTLTDDELERMRIV